MRETIYEIVMVDYFKDFVDDGDVHDYDSSLGCFRNPYEADEIVEYLVDRDLDQAKLVDLRDVKIIYDEQYYGHYKCPGVIRIDYDDTDDHLSREYYITQQVLY